MFVVRPQKSANAFVAHFQFRPSEATSFLRLAIFQLNHNDNIVQWNELQLFIGQTARRPPMANETELYLLC